MSPVDTINPILSAKTIFQVDTFDMITQPGASIGVVKRVNA